MRAVASSLPREPRVVVMNCHWLITIKRTALSGGRVFGARYVKNLA
jgi:hypothetical protein